MAASGLMSFLGLSVLCGTLVLLYVSRGSRRVASPTTGAAGPGILIVTREISSEPTTTLTRPAGTPTKTPTSTVAPKTATPTASRTPEPPPPTADTDGPPAPTTIGPTDSQRIDCAIPLSITLRWQAPGDPSGVSSYAVRLAKSGADFTEEQLFDALPGDQNDLAITADRRLYGGTWLRDGSETGRSLRLGFLPGRSGHAAADLSPTGYRHHVRSADLREVEADDPEGIFGYQLSLQTVLGNGYGEPEIHGWMESTQYDATRSTDCSSTYRWRVYAADMLMNEGEWSEWAYFMINPPGQ
jgi:hypothetical protein